MRIKKDKKKKKENKSKLFLIFLIMFVVFILVVGFFFVLNKFLDSSGEDSGELISTKSVISQNSVPANSFGREWTSESSGLESILNIDYNVLNDTASEFCISLETIELYLESLSEDKNGKKIPFEILKGEDVLIDRQEIDFNEMISTGESCFVVMYDSFEENISFKLGYESVIFSNGDVGTDQYDSSFQHHVFYDENNDRWHIVMIDNGADVHTVSSSDGINWDNGVDIFTGTYDYEDYDCMVDYDSSKTYLHCVVADSTLDYLYYVRAELNSTSPYIHLGNVETPYDASTVGQNSADDVQYPRIGVDGNDCVVIAFVFEDASADEGNQYGVVGIKEDSGTTCGDGDFDIADIETGFPIYALQGASGLAEPFPLGIVGVPDSSGQDDFQLAFVDTDSMTSARLISVFFNGTSNSASTSFIVDSDIEFASNYASFGMTATPRGITAIFGMDDGTTDLDSYSFNKGSSTVTQGDTNIDSYYPTFGLLSGMVTAVSDISNYSEDNIWVFSVDDNDYQDIYYSNYSGGSWSSGTLWQNEASLNNIQHMSSWFNNENCDIMVMWVNGTSNPVTIQADIINTGNCGAAPVVPSCPPIPEEFVLNSNAVFEIRNSTGQVCFAVNDSGDFVIAGNMVEDCKLEFPTEAVFKIVQGETENSFWINESCYLCSKGSFRGGKNSEICSSGSFCVENNSGAVLMVANGTQTFFYGSGCYDYNSGTAVAVSEV